MPEHETIYSHFSKVLYSSKMLYWWFTPRSGQKKREPFWTLSNSSKEWIFSFLLGNDGPLRRVINPKAVQSVIIHRDGGGGEGRKEIPSKFWTTWAENHKWTPQPVPLGRCCISLVHGSACPNIYSTTLCKPLLAAFFLSLGSPLLRHLTFSFTPLGPMHVLEKDHLRSLSFGGLPVIIES